MKWDSLFGGRSLQSVRQARLDQYFRLYEVDFGEPVPDYVAEVHARDAAAVFPPIRHHPTTM